MDQRVIQVAKELSERVIRQAVRFLKKNLIVQ
jgi:hypothetical protein